MNKHLFMKSVALSVQCGSRCSWWVWYRLAGKLDTNKLYYWWVWMLWKITWQTNSVFLSEIKNPFCMEDWKIIFFSLRPSGVLFAYLLFEPNWNLQGFWLFLCLLFSDVYSCRKGFLVKGNEISEAQVGNGVCADNTELSR